MRRRDYELLSRTLKRLMPRILNNRMPLNCWEEFCTGIAVALADDNPHFDKAKFLADCGVMS